MNKNEYGGAVVCEDDGTLCLLLHGTVTAQCRAEVDAAACEVAAAGSDVDVCCEFLDHVDATCVQVLIALRRILVSQGKRLRLTDLSPAVQEELQRSSWGHELFRL